MLAENPEWDGQVAVVLVNKQGSQGGVTYCGDFEAPIVQDGDGDMWKALSASSNTLIIVGIGGIVDTIMTGATFPAAKAEVELALQALVP